MFGVLMVPAVIVSIVVAGLAIHAHSDDLSSGFLRFAVAWVLPVGLYLYVAFLCLLAALIDPLDASRPWLIRAMTWVMALLLAGPVVGLGLAIARPYELM